MNRDPRNQRNGGHRPQPQGVPPKRTPPRGKQSPQKSENELIELFWEVFSKENMKKRLQILRYKSKQLLGSAISSVFLAREKIICGIVTGIILVVLAMLQTTLFSTLRPFGAVPDLMLSFVIALSVTEGRKWGAGWGIAAAVVIEALSVPDIFLLPLLYMPIGYFCGILCRHFLTGSAAVRAVITLAAIPLKEIFTAVYMAVSPIYATPGEVFLQVILPEAAATLLLAAPVHLLVYLCMKPFHHTRADMVSER